MQTKKAVWAQMPYPVATLILTVGLSFAQTASMQPSAAEPLQANPSIGTSTEPISYLVMYLNTLAQPAPDGRVFTWPSGINNAGEVTGTVSNPSGTAAFLWDKMQQMQFLGTLAGDNASQAFGINNSGHVVGESFVYVTGPERAVIWSSPGVVHELPHLQGGSRISIARAINDSDQVVGAVWNNTGNRRAVLWDASGVQDLGVLSGTTDSDALAINDAGQVVGMSFVPGGGANYAFLWDPVNGMQNLGGLPGAIMPEGNTGPFSWAISINNAGKVAGWTADGNGYRIGFIWDSMNGMQPIIPITGYLEVQPTHINSSGTVVGFLMGSPYKPFLWTRSAGMQLLPISSGLATGINDSGQVVGYDVDNRAFMLTPDRKPPTTLASASPNPNTDGWNNTTVTVMLSATANAGTSGIKQIEFALGGAQKADWQTVPGTAASVTISAEGTTILSYFATDNAGNQESTKALTVRIDKTPPILSGLPIPGCTIWPPNHKLLLVATVTAADALSGLAPGSFKVTGTSNDPAKGQIVITGGPSQFNVQLGADKNQVYTLTATTSDLAGNTITKQATCTVPHDQGK